MRKIHLTTLLTLIIILTTLLSSCGKLSKATQPSTPSSSIVISTLTNNNDCLTPPSSIGVIPIGVDVPKQAIKENPPNGWDLVGSLPESTYLSSFAAFDGNEIWIACWDNIDRILRYDTTTNEKKFYYPSDKSVGTPARLFFSHDGTLWSQYVGQSRVSGVPLLSRYDKSTDQFSVVLDQQGLLQSSQEIRSNIVEDNNGSFWMFLNDPTTGVISLHNLNLNTLRLEKHPLQINISYASIGFTPDSQIIWTADQSKGQLIQYFPATHEIHPFDSLPSLGPDQPPTSLIDILKLKQSDHPVYMNIFFDQSGRIWLDNKGWLDFTNPAHPGYYKLIPSPEFIGYYEAPEPKYGELFTSGIFESSDGLIWFTTNGGVIRLDIRQGYEKGEWCLVTNGYSDSIVEDSQHNLWMIVFKKIYKYHIQH